MMASTWPLVLAACVVAACSHSRPRYAPFPSPILPRPRSSDPRRCPTGHSCAVFEQFVEPSLSDRIHSPEGGAYRIAYGPPGINSARLIRVEWRPGYGALVRKEALYVNTSACWSDYRTACIAEDSRTLTESEWQRVDDCFVRGGFFAPSVPSVDPLIAVWDAQGAFYAHASWWRIEGVSGGHWQYVERVSPLADVARRGNTTIYECGRLLLTLAGEHPNTYERD